MTTTKKAAASIKAARKDVADMTVGELLAAAKDTAINLPKSVTKRDVVVAGVAGLIAAAIMS